MVRDGLEGCNHQEPEMPTTLKEYATFYSEDASAYDTRDELLQAVMARALERWRDSVASWAVQVTQSLKERSV